MPMESSVVTYEVTLEVDPEMLEDVERELREHHVPAILATGCFRAVRLDRSADGRLRTTYEAATEPDLQRYLAEHTGRLRAEFSRRFPAGVRVARETWQRVATWPAQ